MDDRTRNILKDDKKILHKYEKCEARYIMGLDDDYEDIEIELDLDDAKYKDLLARLTKLNMCFDEWACNALKSFILQQGGPK